MLRVAIVDANEQASEQIISGVTSIVGHWLSWEIAQAGLTVAAPADADVILLVIASATDWPRLSRQALKRHKIQPDATKRQQRPYIIAGGAADAIALTALQTADAVAVGEAYRFIRAVMRLIADGAALSTIREWIAAYPHAIEGAQVAGLRRDDARPWLLTTPPPILATPDTWVDWDGMPAVRGDDQVVRVVVEKGCWLKCKFCATTYRQTNRQNPNADRVLSAIGELTRRGERAQLVTNDVSNLAYFHEVPKHGKLAQQSLTLAGLKNPQTFDAILASKPRIIRIGVEGLSPRIRLAFGKPIAREELLVMLERLHAQKQMTHLFYIVGAPYETEDDWREYQAFYAELALRIRWGVCRIKYTSFVPDPPTPLARFLPATHYVERMQALKKWVTENAATRHSMSVWARQLTSRIEDYATSYGVSKGVIAGLLRHDETIDLAPTLEDAARMPWEIIDWPLSIEKRWRLGESYKKTMGAQAKAYAGRE
jgi:radical SAM superfamily enzyme YgiQ (UPF0313 family)